MRQAALLFSLALSACATAPVPVPVSPLVGGSGLVIGTLSYQYVEADLSRAAPVVYFDRIDRAGGVRQYAMPVNVDAANHSGVFTGALPAGVYAFRDAAFANRRFAAGALKMPFEVTAGSVQDAGHYALNPLR